MKSPLVALIILDGYGYSENTIGNAIDAAKTTNLDNIWSEYPHTFIQASGLDVGLPEGQMGNSEVGHLNLGAGRIIYQELTRITQKIKDKSFFTNKAFLDAIDNVKNNNSSLHLMGLLSDGGVHSHNTHLYAFLELAKEKGLKDNVYIHCFLDGRDTPPASGLEYVKELEEKIKEIGIGCIATVSGRYYAMDRDQRWERTILAYDALVCAKGETAISAVEAVEQSYHDNTNDEFVLPTVIVDSEGPKGIVKENDSVIFFNFRPDRARQLTRALTESDFDGFERENVYFALKFITMTQYDSSFNNVEIAYKPQVIENTLGEYLSKNNIRQLRIAETEKYAHVTYFFNGGIEKEYQGEDRILVPSPKVATYDLKPKMSAGEVTEKVIEAIELDKYNLIVLNYANCDMVGHTGIFNAAVEAVETVDECIGRVVEEINKKGGYALITSDHGNAEEMINLETSNPHTAHTSNLVKCMLVGDKNISLNEGRLADIAPTILQLIGLDKPEEMTGESLINSSK